MSFNKYLYYNGLELSDIKQPQQKLEEHSNIYDMDVCIIDDSDINCPKFNRNSKKRKGKSKLKRQFQHKLSSKSYKNKKK